MHRRHILRQRMTAIPKIRRVKHRWSGRLPIRHTITLCTAIRHCNNLFQRYKQLLTNHILLWIIKNLQSQLFIGTRTAQQLSPHGRDTSKALNGKNYIIQYDRSHVICYMLYVICYIFSINRTHWGMIFASLYFSYAYSCARCARSLASAI